VSGDGLSWKSTVIALALIALVAAMFLAVFYAAGIDAALKAWAAVGTVVGVITGAMPTYFFGRATTASLRDQLGASNQRLDEERLARSREQEEFMGRLADSISRYDTLIRQLNRHDAGS
jgi:uncharacterized membrane-anchored protein YhcB (DUF1043 family)